MPVSKEKERNITHTRRCIDSNRFGDGFDCICPTPRPFLTKEDEAVIDAAVALVQSNDGRSLSWSSPKEQCAVSTELLAKLDAAIAVRKKAIDEGA